MLRSLLAVLPLVAASTTAQTQERQGDTTNAIAWHQDFATARTLAQRTGAPLLVTFRCEA